MTVLPSIRGTRFRPRTVRLLALAVLLAVVCVLAVTVVGKHQPVAQSAATPALPFDMPTTAELRASPHKVFATYFTPLTLSIDNEPAASDYYARNYLDPEGEDGEHAAYGGLIRDRPLPRDPISSPDWQLQDLETEVREAVAGGIDGFYLDMLQIEGDPDVRVWTTTKLMMRAAQEADPGFKIVLMPDLAGKMREKTPAQLAAATAELATSPSAFRLADGRLVVMPTAAEAHPVAWWRTFMSTMDEQYHQPVALVPIFIANEAGYRDSFAPISYGMSVWGSGNPQFNDPSVSYPTSAIGRAAAVHDLGKLWMQPVRVQDERPNQAIFDEAENTTNLRNTWQIARDTHAEWAHIPTWNDYTEGAEIAPSVRHGYTFLDLDAYYLTWFKTGTRPRIVRDVVYLTHRQQPADATPTYPQAKLMKLRGGSPARDTVEAVTFLTAPGRVTITTGGKAQSCDVPAGVGVCTAPLGLGEVSAAVTRGGVGVTSVTSPYEVTDHPYVQDLQYVGVSSARPTPPGLGLMPTAPVQSATDGSTGAGDTKVETVVADADTYVNRSAPDTSYYSTKFLASRGRPGYVTYLHFTLPAAPERRRLVGVELRLTGTTLSFAASKNRHQVNLEPRGKISASTTWSDRPAVSGPVVGVFQGDLDRGQTQRAALDLAALSTRWVEGGSTADVLLTVSSHGNDNWWVCSSEIEKAKNRPALLLTYR